MRHAPDSPFDLAKREAARDPLTVFQRCGFPTDHKPDGALRVLALCPLHADHEPSLKLWIDGQRRGQWQCYGACKRGGSIVDWVLALAASRGEDMEPITAAKRILTDLGLEDEDNGHRDRVDLDAAHRALTSDKDALKSLVQGRGIRPDLLVAHLVGLHQGSLVFPHATGLHFVPWDAKAARRDRGRQPWWQGNSHMLWPAAVAKAGTDLVVCEGELDALALLTEGVAAASVPSGTGSSVDTDLGGKRVLLCGDDDEAGRAMNARLVGRCYELGAAEVRVWDWGTERPSGQEADVGFDVSDLLALGAPGSLWTEKFEALPVEPRPDALAKLGGEIVPRNLRPGEEAIELPADALTGPYGDFDAIYQEVRAVSWLWEKWVPNGALTVLGGDAEAGKSFLLLRLALSAITGVDWPDGTPGPAEPAPALWIEGESQHATTAERALKMGIPLDLLKHMPSALDGWRFDEGVHLAAWKAYMEQQGCRLLLVDSLSSAYGKDENSAEMRHDLDALAAVARDLNMAVILAHHLRKPGPFATREFDVNDLRGSTTIKQITRSIIGIDQPNPLVQARRIQVAKGSYVAAKPEKLGYDLRHDCKVCFGPPPQPTEIVGQRDRAETFLMDFLRHGGKPANEVFAAAQAAGISEKTLKRAKGIMGVSSFKTAGSLEWFWGFGGPK